MTRDQRRDSRHAVAIPPSFDPTTALPAPIHPPVPALFLDWATRQPEHAAIWLTDVIRTYRELETDAQRLARQLRARGIQRGEVIGVTGQSSYGLIVSILATLLAGGTLLTLDRFLPLERRRQMLSLAECALLLDCRCEVEESEIAALEMEGRTIRVAPDTARTDWAEETYPEVTLPPVDPEDRAYLFFTSGSTGIPKGVQGSHKGLSHFLNWQRTEFAVGPGDRSAQLTGISFDVVLRDILLPLTSGATLCLPDADSDLGADLVLPWMSQAGITLLHTVPSLAKEWLAYDAGEGALRTLRVVFFAGEPLTDTLVARWRRTFGDQSEIVNLYGPTETTLAKFYYRVPVEPSPGVQPVGWPLPQTQGLVVTEEGRLCGIGEEGEIVIRTPFRSLGYIHASERDLRRFAPNPFGSDAADIVYYTGDRGRYRDDGALEILGRLDQQVKIRGVRVESEEVNAVLARHPDVQNSVVIAGTDAAGEARLIAFVVASRASASLVRELRGFLQQLLPSAMIPSEPSPPRMSFSSSRPLPSTPPPSRFGAVCSMAGN